jgi:hypothetical protein
MSALLLSLLFCGIGCYVCLIPFVKTQGMRELDLQDEVSHEKLKLLQSLRDIELEHSLGSIAEVDYQKGKAELSDQLAPLLETKSS